MGCLNLRSLPCTVLYTLTHHEVFLRSRRRVGLLPAGARLPCRGPSHRGMLFSLAPQCHALTKFMYQDRAAQACGSPTVALLRAYSPSATDHFYTTDAVELENAVNNLGYRSEGDAAQVFSSQVSGSVPLYRLYSSVGGDHFYTTSASERDNAIAQDAYRDEGVAAYVYPSSQCGAVPLYRMDNPAVTDHFYTKDAAERSNAIANLGYVDEGIAAYVL